MNIEQTVEIPENRWLNIKVPKEIPTGPMVIIFKPLPKTNHKLTAQDAAGKGLGLGSGPRLDPVEAIERCCGITKQYNISLSSDEFLAMRQKDKELENRCELKYITVLSS